MEHSSNRLYSGPLSQAAQKVLAALRSQSLHTARRSCSYSYNPSQMDRYGSQGEKQSRSLNQDERKDRSTDRDSSIQKQTSETEGYYQRSQMCSLTKNCGPSVFRSRPALTSSEHEVSEMTASFSHGDGRTITNQIPQTLSDGAAFWSIPRPTKTIRPSFNISFSPDNGDPKEESVLAHQTYSSYLKVSVETDKGTSATQKDREWPNNPINEVENSEALDSCLKQSLIDGNNNDATERAEDGGLSKQSKSKIFRKTHVWSSDPLQRLTTRIDANPCRSVRPQERVSLEFKVNSESMACHLSHTELGTKPRINEAMKVAIDTILPTEKRPAIEMKGPLYLGMAENNNLKRTSCLATTCSRNKNFDCIYEQTGIIECIVNECEAEFPSKILPSALSEEHKDPIGGALVQCEPPASDVVDTEPNKLERTTEDRLDMIHNGLKGDKATRATACIDIGTEDITEAQQPHCSVAKTTEKQNEYKTACDLHGGDKGPRESRRSGDEPAIVAASTVDSGKGCLIYECRTRGSGIEALGLCANIQTANGYIREGELKCGRQKPSSDLDISSSEIKPSGKQKNSNLPTPQTASHHGNLVPSFSLKRKHEVLQNQNVNNFEKICPISHPPKWKPLLSSQENRWKGEVCKRKRAVPKVSAPEHLNKAGYAFESELAVGVDTTPCVPQQRKSKTDHMSPFEQTQGSMTCRSYMPNNFGPEDTDQSQTYHKGTSTNKIQARFAAGCLATTLISDPRIKDSGKLNSDEKMRLLEEVLEAKTLVLTMMYQDGTTQLDLEQKSTPPVCGLLVLMKSDLDSNTPESFLGANDSLLFLKLEQTPKGAQQRAHESQKLFTRDVLLQVLSRSQLVICYKAKDFLCTVLQFYKEDFNWKQVAGCNIQDPQVSGWLLDPADPSSCYQDLLNKHCKRPLYQLPVLGTKKVSQVISGLVSLYWLNKQLCHKLQSQGLWDLYSDMEQKMIPVLAAMESHCIHVDKETLKRTSDLLGTKMKQLEQEAHRAAGQIFLVTSNSQLRTVLFEKLRLHEHCENKELPKTINKQQQSTCEATLLQLQHLHPLPKVILEYRQVHKIKSTFVDGILSCMMNKSYISSTWYQTSAVTGRISSKQPNFQALPRQPLQITKKQSIQGREEEVVTVHPRAVFIPLEGWTFLAADFCQVELRLLAHLSSDPELLRIFANPQADVFTMLASQWKGIGESHVTSEDREHAKRIVYSVVYGAGCKRLSGILGVSAERASQFQDSFLQTYKKVEAFIHRTIQQCHKQGYVLSIMGRRRTLPNINSPDWAVRMQAERQAVNFVVQGSAADLCKMAMIRIFNLVSSSSALSARLVAQLHDELLYEVEDSQVEHFAALVKTTMESMQHIHRFGVHLKVPLKVTVSSGKSWGSMSELNIPSTSPISYL